MKAFHYLQAATHVFCRTSLNEMSKKSHSGGNWIFWTHPIWWQLKNNKLQLSPPPSSPPSMVCKETANHQPKLQSRGENVGGLHFIALPFDDFHLIMWTAILSLPKVYKELTTNYQPKLQFRGENVGGLHYIALRSHYLLRPGDASTISSTPYTIEALHWF